MVQVVTKRPLAVAEALVSRNRLLMMLPPDAKRRSGLDPAVESWNAELPVSGMVKACAPVGKVDNRLMRSLPAWAIRYRPARGPLLTTRYLVGTGMIVEVAVVVVLVAVLMVEVRVVVASTGTVTVTVSTTVEIETNGMAVAVVISVTWTVVSPR